MKLSHKSPPPNLLEHPVGCYAFLHPVFCLVLNDAIRSVHCLPFKQWLLSINEKTM